MTTLRDDYDPNEVPLNSSAIRRVDTTLFDLALEEDVAEEGSPAANHDVVEQFESTIAHRVSPRVRVQRSLDRLAYRISRSRGLQAAWLAAIVACIGLLYFSLTFRLEHIDDNFVLLQQLGELDTELLGIQSRWSAQEMEALERSVETADTRRVFLDYQNLAVWLTEKSFYANQLNLEFGYVLGESEPSAIAGMVEVPIEVTLEGSKSDQVYLRALEFMKRVVGTAYYVEITEATVRGNGSGAEHLDATLRVWVHTTVKAASHVE
ncbi:MAG: hypothetical protein AAFN07_06465 [Pseudomonadota bacterium]